MEGGSLIYSIIKHPLLFTTVLCVALGHNTPADVTFKYTSSSKIEGPDTVGGEPTYAETARF